MSEIIDDLEKLAEICLDSAKTIKQYLKDNGHPQPTFDQNGPLFYPSMSPEAEYARLRLRSASIALHELATGPERVGLHPHDYLQDLNAYAYVYHYKTPYAVPENEIIAYKDVAQKTGTDEKQLRKFVRQLIQTHVFCEPMPGYVAHTAASKALKHPGLQAYNAYQVCDNLPLVARQLDAITKWGHASPEPNQTPGNLYYSSDKTIYKIYETHPPVLTRFSDLMNFVSGFNYFSNAHVATGFDWTVLGTGVVVDIGGSMGHCCLDIAKVNPNLTFIVQDLPAVVTRAQDPATSLVPPELRDRITFMAHDFYDPQPVQADAYFLRMIMHDFSDKYCIKILRAIVTAMKPGSRIIIMDQVLPPVGVLPGVFERTARTLQLQMQILSNGVEREWAEWVELVRETDERLRIRGVKQPAGSLMSVIEVVLEDKSDG